MSDLARPLRDKLALCACIEAPRVVGDTAAQDGTRKWLLKVDGSNAVEAVFIPESNRGTLCVSSQAGCVLDCAFCSTGKRASTATSARRRSSASCGSPTGCSKAKGR